MNGLTDFRFTIPESSAIVSVMPEVNAQLKRVFVKIMPETKRRLDHLAVEAGVDSTEVYAGRLVTEAVDRLWQNFDPFKGAPPKPRPKPKLKAK